MVYEVRVSRELCEAMALWLPQRDFATHPTHARALLTEFWIDPIRGDALIALERELATLATDFSQGMSWTQYRPPVGRGQRQASTQPWPCASSWELSSACALDTLTLQDPSRTHQELRSLCAMLGQHPLDVLLLSLLALPSVDDAQTLLAHADAHPELARDPIVQWLRERPTRSIPCEFFSQQAIDRALAGRWQHALDVAPSALREPRTTTIKRNDEVTEIIQCLAQLLTHGALGSPTKLVLDRSMAVLFGHWALAKKGPAYSSTRVAPRMAALALYRALVDCKRAPIQWLHAMREHNEHLTQPIERRPRAPEVVTKTVEDLRDLARRGIARDGTLQRAEDDGGWRFAIA